MTAARAAAVTAVTARAAGEGEGSWLAGDVAADGGGRRARWKVSLELDADGGAEAEVRFGTIGFLSETLAPARVGLPLGEAEAAP